MKLIMAIVQDKDSNRLANEFIDANIRATKLSSTGGFLKAGNSTFIIGIEDDRVQDALELIKKTCQSRKQYVSTPMSLDISLTVKFLIQSKSKSAEQLCSCYRLTDSINIKKGAFHGGVISTRISASCFCPTKKKYQAWAHCSCLSF